MNDSSRPELLSRRWGAVDHLNGHVFGRRVGDTWPFRSSIAKVETRRHFCRPLRPLPEPLPDDQQELNIMLAHAAAEGDRYNIIKVLILPCYSDFMVCMYFVHASIDLHAFVRVQSHIRSHPNTSYARQVRMSA